MNKKIGQYELGCRSVELYVAPGEVGGRFELTPAGGVSRITVGIAQRHWQSTASVLMHEALELAFTDAGLRYCPAPDWANDAAAYLFTMTHQQFGEATARAAYFVTAALPDLSKAYKRWGGR